MRISDWSSDVCSSDLRKTLRHQQMGDDLVDIQRLDEALRAQPHLFLAALRLFGLGHDVDRPAGELGRQPDVLAAPADCQAQLIVEIGRASCRERVWQYV